MEMIKKTTVFLLIFAILTNGNGKLASEDSEIISKVINISKGSIVTTGIKADFEFCSNEEKKYDAMLNEISKKFTIKENLKNENYSSTDFKEGEASGYLECIKSGDKNKFSLCIEKNGDKNNLEELEKMVSDITANCKEKFKSHKYIKCKLEDNNILNTNKELIEKIQAEGFSSVQTIKYNNGYSNVAFVQRGDNKELVNFVVCNYSSGNYLIVGTPEIFTEF